MSFLSLPDDVVQEHFYEAGLPKTRRPDAIAGIGSAASLRAVMATSPGFERLDDILEHDEQYVREFWAWYTIGILIILSRYPVRIRMVGVRGLRGDDYVTVLVGDPSLLSFPPNCGCGCCGIFLVLQKPQLLEHWDRS